MDNTLLVGIIVIVIIFIGFMGYFILVRPDIALNGREGRQGKRGKSGAVGTTGKAGFFQNEVEVVIDGSVVFPEGVTQVLVELWGGGGGGAGSTNVSKDM